MLRKEYGRKYSVNRGLEQGEARHRKCKRFKVGGSQAYDRSSDKAAVVA
jgi:hypothetical protein